jgi:hypothetical protein
MWQRRHKLIDQSERDVSPTLQTGRTNQEKDGAAPSQTNRPIRKRSVLEVTNWTDQSGKGWGSAGTN